MQSPCELEMEELAGTNLFDLIRRQRGRVVELHRRDLDLLRRLAKLDRGVVQQGSRRCDCRCTVLRNRTPMEMRASTSAQSSKRATNQSKKNCDGKLDSRFGIMPPSKTTGRRTGRKDRPSAEHTCDTFGQLKKKRKKKTGKYD